MRKLKLLLSMMMVFVLLVGCGGSEEPQEAEVQEAEVAETAEEVTESQETESSEPSEPLQMLWWNDGIEGDVMQGIIDDFTAETGIEVELVVLAYDDFNPKLRTMIRGGEAPALSRATEGTIAEFMDFLLPLDTAYNAEDYTGVYYNKDGSLIALPMDFTANGLFVNYDILDKYEVNYPALGESWTWAEFETEMAKLMGKEDVAYPGVFDNKAHRFMPMVYQFGGKLWNEPYSDMAIDEGPAVEALTTLQRMNSNGTLDPSVWAGAAKPNELFQTGLYGFHMSGNWFVAAYQDLPFNWGVVPMPVGNGGSATRSTIFGGKTVCALNESGQEEEALKFIEYLAKGENHDKFTSGVPFLSPRLAADIDFGEFQAAYEVFQDEITNTPITNVMDWQYQTNIAGMYPIINKAVEDAMKGDDVTEVLKKLEADLIEKAEDNGL